MSQSPDETPKRKTMPVPVAIAVLVVGFGALYASRWLIQDAAPTPEIVKTQQIARLKAETVKLFPEALKADSTSDDEGKLADFLARSSPRIANAPDASLAAILQKRLDLLKLLKASDVQACARAATSGDVDPAASPKGFVMVGDTTVATLHALRDAIDHPVERGPRTPEDRAALTRAVAASGAAPDVQALALRTSSLRTALPSQQCDAVILLYQAMLSLPPDVRSRSFLASLIYSPGAASR